MLKHFGAISLQPGGFAGLQAFSYSWEEFKFNSDNGLQIGEIGEQYAEKNCMH
jgi:hypothetical protein